MDSRLGSVFEAFTAEALAAMGKPEARELLYRRLDEKGVTAHRTQAMVAADGAADDASLELASASCVWLESRKSRLDVPYEKYKPLRGAILFEEDVVCEYEKSAQERRAENTRFFDSLEARQEVGNAGSPMT